MTPFLISNFRRVLNGLFFLLDDSPAYEFYMPTFRNTLSHSEVCHPRCAFNNKYHNLAIIIVVFFFTVFNSPYSVPSS